MGRVHFEMSLPSSPYRNMKFAHNKPRDLSFRLYVACFFVVEFCGELSIELSIPLFDPTLDEFRGEGKLFVAAVYGSA